MKGFIYKITNDINDKIYIGKTLSSIEKRFSEHLKDSSRLKNEKRPLYNAMNKYGIEHFNVELIEEVSLENLEEREKYWINFYNSYEKGYNATLGGDGKQLFDYDEIVLQFYQGKLIKDIAADMHCCKDTVAQALALANIDSSTNQRKLASKGLIAKTKDGDIVEIFNSRKEAVLWLQKNNYTTSSDIDTITAVVGRAANGQRKTAYGFQWENL